MLLLESFPFDRAVNFASGNDSEVFYAEGYIAKIYQTLGIDRIEGYRDITNLVSNHLDKNPLACAVRTRKNPADSHQGIVKVNPILEIGEHDGKAVAISEYIPGPKLDSFYESSRWWRSEMTDLDPQEQIRIRQFARTFKWGAWLSPNLGHIWDQFRRISKIVGIYPGFVNLKVRFNIPQDRYEYIVTDLGSDLELLEGHPKAFQPPTPDW